MVPPEATAQRQLDRLLDYVEVQAILGLGYRSVRRLVAAGRLKAIRLGVVRGPVRFRREDVLAFLDANQAVVELHAAGQRATGR